LAPIVEKKKGSKQLLHGLKRMQLRKLLIATGLKILRWSKKDPIEIMRCLQGAL
jgi:hypothetical protein